MQRKQEYRNLRTTEYRQKKTESPQKAKNDDNPEGVAKKIKKNAFFCMAVCPVFTQFLLFGK
jgi:hypothetical protein